MTTQHEVILDGLSKLNALLSVVVFIGIGMTTTNINSFKHISSMCEAGIETAERAFVCGLLSFILSVFATVLFNFSLIIRRKVQSPFIRSISVVGMVVAEISQCASWILLTVTLVDVTQIKLGKVSCSKLATVMAAFMFVFIIPPVVALTGVIIYITIY